METGEFENDIGSIISDKKDWIYEVELEDGSIIKVNEKHPFIIVEDGIIKEMSITDGLTEGVDVVVMKNDINTLKVKSVKKIGISRVINLTVNKNHTFVTENGIVTHNCDYLTPSAQAVLRGTIESFSKTCTFILTCNYPNRIIEPLHSRLAHTEFKVVNEEKPQLLSQLYKRVVEILNKENIEFENEVLIKVLTKFYPDVRKVLNSLQQYGRGGKIDTGILMAIKGADLVTLIQSMKNKSFKEIRQWCADNKNNDTSSLYGKLYKELKEFLNPESIPEAILILEEYQRFDSTVPDKELHLAAMALQMGLSLQFK